MSNVLTGLAKTISSYETKHDVKPLTIKISQDLWQQIMALPLEDRRKEIGFINKSGQAIVCINNVPVLVDDHYIFWKDYKYGQ